MKTKTITHLLYLLTTLFMASCAGHQTSKSATANIFAPIHLKGGAGTQLKQLEEQVKAAGFEMTSGKILYAGPRDNGSHWVEYQDQKSGWGSEWPDWAYESALASLLQNKKVTVAFKNGEPVGRNLVLVLILSEPTLSTH